MFDINKTLNDAIAAAVSTHITTLQQEYANKMAEMAEKITALDDRIAALENQALVVSYAVDKRLLALENNPAQGVDTTLEQRIAALEQHTAVLDQHGGIVEYLDNQEWFWGKIRNFTDSAVESAVEQHCEEYAHGDYDRVVSALDGVDLDDDIKREEDARIHLRF
jgi:uncharacterized coiled-coil protein SlyX